MDKPVGCQAGGGGYAEPKETAAGQASPRLFVELMETGRAPKMWKNQNLAQPVFLIFLIKNLLHVN